MCTITPVCDIHSRHILCALGLFIFLKHLKAAKTRIPNIHFYPTTTMFIHTQAYHNIRVGNEISPHGWANFSHRFHVFKAVITRMYVVCMTGNTDVSVVYRDDVRSRFLWDVNTYPPYPSHYTPDITYQPTSFNLDVPCRIPVWFRKNSYYWGYQQQMPADVMKASVGGGLVKA
jgi:hypothetical protein